MDFPKWMKISFMAVGALWTLQIAYFLRVCGKRPDPAFQPDLVVVYGGEIPSSRFGLDLAKTLGCPIYISEATWKLVPFKTEITVMGNSATIDPRALTTDQNARYAALFIRQGGYKRVALVCAWHHEPRALFLTRLYLLGSGVRVEPYPNEPSPAFYWARELFWLQWVKLWGSLARVALEWVGVRDWPAPQLIRTEPDE